MRLRNIPGAKDAIEESIYVIQNPQENKGCWDKVFPQNQPIHLEVGMGKGRFLMDMAGFTRRSIISESKCMTACSFALSRSGRLLQKREKIFPI